MLSFCNHHGKQGRREFLRVGGLALGGLTLPGLLSLQAQAAGSGTLLKNKSVIFLFMHGGPSQIETFDPKMTAPSGIHSVTGEVATKIPGVTFGGTFPRLAQLADRNANLGSLYSRVVGANHPENGMPTNAVLFPQAIDDKMLPAVTQFGKFDSHGLMGSAYAPFVPGAGGDMQSNMSLSISPNRLDDRRLLLSKLDCARWAAEKSETFAASSQLQQQAFDVILGGVSRAFDLSQEDPAVVARYDTAPLVKPASISTRWKNYKRYIDNAQSLGKLLLMARRLCEAGCGFVTITTNFVWDMHADKNNAGVGEGMDYMGVPFDHAVSAFMEDVHASGVSDDILLVCTGEMGRTPKLNSRGGRDHWGNLSPLMLSGGGLNMGQVIGQSDRHAGGPQTEPIERKDLVTSIMHTLFDLGELRITRGVPNEVVQVATAGTPIPGLF